MPIDLYGMISHRLQSEIIPPTFPVFDHDFIRDFARAHEQGGFDRVLVGYYSNAPDGFLVAAHAAASTERLGLLLAHRPGFVSPTVAAAIGVQRQRSWTSPLAAAASSRCDPTL